MPLTSSGTLIKLLSLEASVFPQLQSGDNDRGSRKILGCMREYSLSGGLSQSREKQLGNVNCDDRVD